MADQKLILNVDDDWKRQAQEEKRKLAEQEAIQKQAASPSPVPVAPDGATAISEDELEAAGNAPFASLVQSLLTQTLVYLGSMGSRNGMPMMNLDSARKAVDMLGALDEKCKGNLNDLEQRLLDTALYEARNRFVSVASQMLGP
jgi:hypothetical protein